MNKLKISAVICTYNRGKFLKLAIKSLLNQSIPKKEYEIIIIDNASSDNTKKIVKEFSKFKNIKYFYQPKIGHSNSRNLGIEKSKGEYIAFLDDDAISSKNWLKKIISTFKKNKNAVCVGGKVELIFDNRRPDWLSDNLLTMYSFLDLSKETISLKKKYLHGCNIAFKKDIIKRLGGFNENLGRKKENLLSGEEILLQKIIIKNKHQIIYNPKINIKHNVLNNRLKKRWIFKRFWWEGKTNAIIDFDENLITRSKLIIMLIETIKLFVSLRIFSLLLPNKNKFIFENQLITIMKISYILELLRKKD